MISAEFYDVLLEITRIMEEKGKGISYILNGNHNYIIGTKIYNEEIAQYLNKTVDKWEGSEANIKKRKKKGKRMNETSKKVGYLWKIPVE